MMGVRFMGINMRGKISGEMIAPDSIQTIHLKNGSVETAKIANQAITAVVIADNAITPNKVQEKVRTRDLAGNDVEVSVLGTTEAEVKSLRFAVKDAANATPDKIIVALEMKTSNATATASMLVYVDGEVAPRATVTSTSILYEVLSFSFAIGAGAAAGTLAEGVHTLSFRLKSSSATETAYNMLLEVKQAIL